MRPIPKPLLNRLLNDPFMYRCIYNNEQCSGRVEFEHALLYSGKQINEWWAIVPCCTYHHRGKGLDKDFNRYCAIRRAAVEDLKKYPKVDWLQLKNYLASKYEHKKRS